MADDIQVGSYEVKDSKQNKRVVQIFQTRTEATNGVGPKYLLGVARHLLDGKRVSRVEKGLYQVEDTGEYLTSNDPVAP